MLYIFQKWSTISLSLIDSASKCSFIMESFLRVEVKSLVLDTRLNNNNDCVHYIETTTSQGMW